ncbi:hypothetical protein [Rhodococcus sp. 14C212]|uniref:hypothetical protein n=1 Tax=Rhodococcus sp. 14C212 TaxID=2711209 RepID=UPI001F118BB8|nr:hypothetical protein [Rhodococcus sp. 14C212]
MLVGLVHSASVQDRVGARLVLAGARTRFPGSGLVWVDGGYVNSVDAGLVDWAARTENLEVVVVPGNADVKDIPGAAPAVGGREDLRMGDEV